MIEQSIIAGQCSHVDDVPSKCTRETKVNEIHIAIASNNVEVAIRYYKNCYAFVPTEIFKLTPFHIALLKGKGEIIDIARTALVNSGRLTHLSYIHKIMVQTETTIRVLSI